MTCDMKHSLLMLGHYPGISLWSAIAVLLPILLPVVNPWSLGVNRRSELLNDAGIDRGIPMSFVDYNGDRFTDIVYLEEDGVSLSLALMFKEKKATMQPLLTMTVKESIQSVIAGDFNGDSKVDFLILTTSGGSTSQYRAFLALHPAGHTERMGNVTEFALVTQLPLTLDYNADGIMDFLAENAKTGKTSVWLGQTDPGSGMKEEVIKEISIKWSTPGYSGFLDALSDFRPGILLHMNNEFRYFPNQEGSFAFSSPNSIPYPTGAQVIGAPVFQDWYGNGKAGLLLPYCTDAKCEKSHLAIYNFLNQSWTECSIDWGYWRLLLSNEVRLSNKVALPAISPLRAGDVNLDRFPDVTTVVKNVRSNDQAVGVFLFDGIKGWVFNVLDSDTVGSNVTDVAFFDVNEDSVLDFITVYTSDSGMQMQLFTQTADTADNYFLKVMVLTGRCSYAGNCNLPSKEKLPYGLPVPGATLRYLTEGVHGDRLYGKALLSSTSSYQALQLPFHIFGLGSFANYIEDLTIAMPTITQSTRQHDFTFIVPKTQVVIIPYPLDQPSKWKYLLYIDPFHDRKVIFVAVALVSVAFIVIIIISVLQYLEYREDKLEKLKEVQKFSFDAM